MAYAHELSLSFFFVFFFLFRLYAAFICKLRFACCIFYYSLCPLGGYICIHLFALCRSW